MSALHQSVAVCLLLALAATPSYLAHAAQPCPSGLQCANKGPSVPQAQPVGYLGNGFACQPLELPPLACDNDISVYGALTLAQTQYLTTLETPFVIRFAYLYTAAAANALTAFHPTALPYAYKPGYGLPFTARISGAGNNTCAKNTALAYAVYTYAKALSPTTAPAVAQVLTALGLSTSYTGASNFADPRDVGNAAALAVIAYAQNDGWNEDGTNPDGTPQAQHYSDFTNFVPANTPYQLTDITKWQPLLESARNGYFVAQTHVAVQIQSNKIEPYSESAATFYKKYNISSPYPKNLNAAALAFYKAQADLVIKTQASLNDSQKMIAELFDNKLRGFGAVPILQYYFQFNWDLYQLVVFDAHAHAALYDATLAMWALKPKINGVRPASAIRYLYNNKNITAWAGPFQGTKSFPGRKYNSYLRTMPHADYPSGTTCVCVAWAEFTERFLNRVGTLPYATTFPKGCSFVEPGLVPAQDISISFSSTQEFINTCSQTRLWAGVHFQQSIDAAKKVCTGMGVAAYNKYVKLRDGTA